MSRTRWAARSCPDWLPATYGTHWIRYFHGCCSPSEDRLWGMHHEPKGGAHAVAAYKSVRAPGQPAIRSNRLRQTWQSWHRLGYPPVA
jgi:hypothetical protein